MDDFRTSFISDFIACIDCSVLTYQDTNEQPGDLEDPWCGKRTKDDQLGTVFAIPNMTAVDKGVDVLAIDDGQIENVEMRWPDQPGKGCGNGVIIRHKGGWVSRYCGLRQASTILNKGDYVKKGQRIGLAGLTGGRLPWPGLFFTLDRYDRPYDLWTGNAVTAGCRKHAPLIAGLTYQPLSLVQSGITSPAAPLPHKLMKGIPMPPSLKPTDPIVIWAQVEGLAQGDQVVATARDGASRERLAAQGATPIELDVADVRSVAGLAWRLDGYQFERVYYVAGVFGPRTQGLQPPSELDFDAVMHTNVLGPMRVVPQLLDVLAPGARIGLLSSRMGSITLRANAAGWLYRASKAALNSVMRDIALVLDGRALCVSLHPGWVRTDMGGEQGDIDVATSAAGLRQVLGQLSPAHNGRFFNYDGESLAW